MRAGNRKGLWICAGFLLCLFLVFAPGDANALPVAYGTVEIDLSTVVIELTDGLTIAYRDNPDGTYDMNGSSSKAKVELDPDEGDRETYEIVQEGPTEGTRASVRQPDARATAYTTNTTLSGSVRASGQPGIQNKAETEMKQWMYFDILTTGTLALSVDYYMTQAVDFESVDEWGKAKSEVKLELGKDRDKDEDKFKIEWKDLTIPLTDEYMGTLTVSYFYDQDDIGGLGFLKMTAKNKVETYMAPASPVPEPATMLLLGAGLIGFAGVGRKKLFHK